MSAQADDAAKAMKTRKISHCGLNCGTLKLKRGVETVFSLDFQANSGANGIVLGDPSVTTVLLIKLGNPVRHELSLRAIKSGSSSMTIRGPDGEVMAHFEIVVDD